MLVKILPFLLASAAFLSFLLYSVFLSANPINTLLLIIFVFLVGLGLFDAFPKMEIKSFTWLEMANMCSAHMIGAVATYFLVQQLHFTSVVAAATIGLLGYFGSIFLVKNQHIDLAPNIYSGTFVGMTSAAVLSAPWVALAGTFSGVLFIFLSSRFNGYGGKLGSVAFMSTVITSFLSHLS
jgi:hypothetical protein